MNLIGIVQGLLLNILAIAGLNDPQLKVTPTGFLQMLLENGANTMINNLEGLRSGQDRVVKIRYMKRGLESDVTDRDDCETTITPTWSESVVTRPLTSKIGISIPDNLMRSLQTEATAAVSANAGDVEAKFSRVLYETVLVKMNGLIQKINANLLSTQSTAWGVNAAYGDDSPHAINFGKALAMDDGIVKLLLDAQTNEINGKLLLVGNGAVMAYQIMNGLKSGIDQHGVGQVDFTVYNDMRSASIWGINHFGAFAPGLIAFVDWNKNVGSYSGEKGGSVFFKLPIPLTLANGVLSALELDAQLSYKTCPEYDQYGALIADRGYQLTLSKHYGLWNAPGDMFDTTDRLYGFNGSLHYIGAPKINVVTVQPNDGAEWITAEPE
jgi:hypothetical protein